MKWRLVLSLAGFGVAMGVASVLGMTRGIEAWLWLAIALICGTLLAVRVESKPWFHGFCVGLIGGGVAPLIQFLFFSTYLANNPEIRRDMAQIPDGLDPRYFVLLLAPVAGLLSGVVLGTGTWAAARLVTRRGGTQ